MVNIEINGKQIQAREGSMVIEAADDAGITIPRFCYHKKLSIAANCRMCLVEVEKANKPLPACATPVTEGMRIFTKSHKALEAQKGVMEFLLINHPLDCPICDQGGECDLQEMAMGYGKDVSRFTEGKRVVQDKNIGPLISTDMTRCIHCTRCVRFGQEVAGLMELGATGRGEHMEIGTYVEHAISSELSGNMIDLCPVGALTSKPFRYTARPWELHDREGVAAHDCIGSHITVQVRRESVMRVLPREAEEINETWISDRDRFSYVGLYDEQRLPVPMIKKDGTWHEVPWETALEHAVAGLKQVIDTDGADQVGALISPSATVEEMYLLQKLMRGLKVPHVDHRLRELDFRDQSQAPVQPGLGQTLREFEENEAVLLVGSYVRKEQPIAGQRLRKAALRGARVSAINPVAFDFNFPMSRNIAADAAGMVRTLAGVAKALDAKAPAALQKVLDGVKPGEAETAIAADLKAAGQGVVLLGSIAQMHEYAADLRALAHVVAEAAGLRVGSFTDGANGAGGWLAGAVPHRHAAGQSAARIGLDARAMLAESRKAYVLHGIEPEFDCAEPAQALAAMRDADFVVALTSFASDTAREYADVLLPIGAFPETSGTFVNTEGRWQSFGGTAAPLQEARPGWKVLRVLGNLFGVQGFDYFSSEEVRDEVRQLCEGAEATAGAKGWMPDALPAGRSGLNRVAMVPAYSVDALLRRSLPLQQTPDAIPTAVYASEATAEKAGVRQAEEVELIQGEFRVVLPLVIDEAIAPDCVFVPLGTPGSSTLGAGFGPVELKAR